MNRIFLLLPGFLLAVSPAARAENEKDEVTNVPANDPDMAAAMAKARELLPQFWKTFEEPKRGEKRFHLKVKITDANGGEHFWMSDIERKNGKIFGTINNEPKTVKSVKFGQRIEVPEADISDWLYIRDGMMVGNYTLRALFKTMPPEQVETFKKGLAEP